MTVEVEDIRVVLQQHLHRFLSKHPSCTPAMASNAVRQLLSNMVREKTTGVIFCDSDMGHELAAKLEASFEQMGAKRPRIKAADLIFDDWLRLPGEASEYVSVVMEKQDISVSKRELSGQFFTPSTVVGQIVRRALMMTSLNERYARDSGAFRVLEPSVGQGYFVFSLLRELARIECQNQGIEWVDEHPSAPDIERINTHVRLWLPETIAATLTLADMDSECIRSTTATLALLQDAFGVPDKDRGEPPVFVGDAIHAAPLISEEGFDLVIGNPPWISYSGRQSKRDDDYVSQLVERYEELRRWPSLHGAFVLEAVKHWLSGEPGSALALLLPEPLAHLSGYGRIRRVIRGRCDVDEPLERYADDIFTGVTQASFALLAGVMDDESMQAEVSDAPFKLHVFHQQTKGGRHGFPPGWLQALDARPRPPSEWFGDIGVHTGNCARTLIVDEFQKGVVPVLEGKDVQPFRCDPHRRWLRVNYKPSEGEYFRIGKRSRYQSARVLIRQTADGIIAGENHEEHYFRNSALACFPPEEFPLSWMLAWLNHDMITAYHRASVYESSQRSFPQVKVSHLRNLPVPDWDVVKDWVEEGGEGSLDEAIGAGLLRSTRSLRGEALIEM